MKETSMRPLTIVLEVWIAVAAAASVAAVDDEIPHVMVFPGANSRATYFTLHSIREAQSVSTGEGVKVGILDHLFGIDLHPELYAGGENFLGEDQAWKLSSTAEHKYWMALVLKEITPDVEVYALNVSSRDEGEKVDALLRAVDWAIEHELDVLTYSSRRFSPEHRPRVDAAVERAHEVGIVTTFIHYGHPGNLLPGGLFSGLEDGREPDVFVLHRDYTVLFVHEYARLERGERSDWYRPFLSLSSTSSVTAGVVAMLRSLRGDLTPAGCRHILRQSGRPLEFEGQSVPRALDAAAAVRLAEQQTTVAGTLEGVVDE